MQTAWFNKANKYKFVQGIGCKSFYAVDNYFTDLPTNVLLKKPLR